MSKTSAFWMFVITLLLCLYLQHQNSLLARRVAWLEGRVGQQGLSIYYLNQTHGR